MAGHLLNRPFRISSIREIGRRIIPRLNFADRKIYGFAFETGRSAGLKPPGFDPQRKEPLR
jgi:hypothetical protein